jgi:hypothetical protein
MSSSDCLGSLCKPGALFEEARGPRLDRFESDVKARTGVYRCQDGLLQLRGNLVDVLTGHQASIDRQDGIARDGVDGSTGVQRCWRQGRPSRSIRSVQGKGCRKGFDEVRNGRDGVPTRPRQTRMRCHAANLNSRPHQPTVSQIGSKARWLSADRPIERAQTTLGDVWDETLIASRLFVGIHEKRHRSARESRPTQSGHGRRERGETPLHVGRATAIDMAALDLCRERFSRPSNIDGDNVDVALQKDVRSRVGADEGHESEKWRVCGQADQVSSKPRELQVLQQLGQGALRFIARTHRRMAHDPLEQTEGISPSDVRRTWGRTTCLNSRDGGLVSCHEHLVRWCHLVLIEGRPDVIIRGRSDSTEVTRWLPPPFLNDRPSP